MKLIIGDKRGEKAQNHNHSSGSQDSSNAANERLVSGVPKRGTMAFRG